MNQVTVARGAWRTGHLRLVPVERFRDGRDRLSAGKSWPIKELQQVMGASQIKTALQQAALHLGRAACSVSFWSLRFCAKPTSPFVRDALMLALCFLLFCCPVGAQTAQGRLVQFDVMKSAHVQPRNITVWLPPGYDSGTRRYPVIYMQDGQNLFEPGRSFGGEEWGIDETLTRLSAEGKTRGALVVGVWNTNLRGREYLPAKPLALLPPETQARVTAIHGGTALSDAYLAFLVTELKPFVDRQFRTRKKARDTFVMGSSMGGLISLYAMAEYPDVFGAAAAVSIHWPLANPVDAPVTERAAIAAAFKSYLSASKLRPGKNRLYMDHGTLDLDSYYRPYSEQVEAFMPSLGWHRDTDWVSRVFDGAGHNEKSWRARADVPLGFLLGSGAP